MANRTYTINNTQLPLLMISTEEEDENTDEDIFNDVENIEQEDEVSCHSKL
ncbi:MAG: hypothetical protein WAX04_12855 [Oscillospiraceae bacterium]